MARVTSDFGSASNTLLRQTCISLWVSIGFLLWGLFGAKSTWAAEIPDTLLRNVRVIRTGDSTQMDLVSLIILNGKLEMVSKDELVAQNSIQVFDAKGSYLLGNLAVGGPANFLILNQNPSDDLDVLLDVNSYLEFAVKEGELVINNLGKDTNIAESGDRGKSPDQARSYQPPPAALPSSTTYTESWFHYDTGFISGVFTGVLAVDSMHWGSQDSASEDQFGDLKTYDGSEVKGFEIGVDGSFNFKTPWAYKMFIADNTFGSGYDTYKDDNVTIRDLIVAIPLTTETTVTIGKQKEPISLERITGLLYLPSQNRTAAADAMLRSRNVGVEFNSTAFAERMTWSGGVFNDWLDDEGSISENSTELTGRVTFLPYVSEDESRRLHLGLGARFSNAADPVRFLSKPEFGMAPIFVDTDTSQAENITSYNLEAYWQSGSLWLGGEYILTDIDAPSLNDPKFSGYHVMASWIFSGEQRRYIAKKGLFSPVPVAQSIMQNGNGSWEVFARWSTVDLTDGLVEGGEMDIFSVGLNWWLTPTFNTSINFRQIELDRFGVVGKSTGTNISIMIMTN